MKARFAILLLAASGLFGVAVVVMDRQEHRRVQDFESALEALLRETGANRPAARDAELSARRAALVARCEELLEWEGGEDPDDESGDAITPAYWQVERRQELRRAVATRGDVFLEIEGILETARREGCLEIPCADDPQPGSLQATRRGTNLLCSRAVLRGGDGDLRAAVVDLERALDLGQLLSGETLLDGMIRLANESIVLQAARHVAQDTGSISGDLEELILERFAPSALVRQARRYLRGEAGFILARLGEAREADRAEWLAAAREQVRGMRAGLRSLDAPDALLRECDWPPHELWRQQLASRWLAHCAIAVGQCRSRGEDAALDAAHLNRHLPVASRLTPEALTGMALEREGERVRLSLRARPEDSAWVF